jgi:alkaline phosphatase
VVEGGGIDWMAHNRDIAGTARDVVAFDDAVAVAYSFASADGDTLVVVTADHETGGLQVGGSPDAEFIAGVTASTAFMHGLINREGESAEDVLATYAGVTDLTQAEKDAIDAYGEMGISDALSLRANVTWGWSGRDEGSHTATEVPVFAFGPGSEPFEGSIDNTDIGNELFGVVSGN